MLKNFKLYAHNFVSSCRTFFLCLSDMQFSIKNIYMVVLLWWI
ncbi:hypothetical protein APHNP_0283 [Anaplasma phagocytophilum str. ApNP]|uniref:Uncharacterized protein n=1 Tax=Anaplasma phagocytophilum str. ApNP TaxID=1359153 RepID=A0A0F3NGT1_ANAPH|nr:hypothetical protein APHNP_0283 [Anaplasma phagocytophilum str. ApNP]